MVRDLNELLRRCVTPTAVDVESDVAALINQPIDFAKQLHSLQAIFQQANLDAASAHRLSAAILMARTQHLMTPEGAAAPDPFATAALFISLLRIWWLEQKRKANQRQK